MKSSKSFANGDCVQVAILPDRMIGVRNSRHPDGPVLRFTLSEWTAFIDGVWAEEFDLATLGNPSPPA